MASRVLDSRGQPSRDTFPRADGKTFSARKHPIAPVKSFESRLRVPLPRTFPARDIEQPTRGYPTTRSHAPAIRRSPRNNIPPIGYCHRGRNSSWVSKGELRLESLAPRSCTLPNNSYSCGTRATTTPCRATVRHRSSTNQSAGNSLEGAVNGNLLPERPASPASRTVWIKYSTGLETQASNIPAEGIPSYSGPKTGRSTSGWPTLAGAPTACIAEKPVGLCRLDLHELTSPWRQRIGSALSGHLSAARYSPETPPAVGLLERHRFH